MSRADLITPKSKQTEYYSDFLMNLDRNPISGEVARVNNERAVVRALKNLINTNRGERVSDSSIGCGLSRLLFEPIDEITSDLIKTSIMTTIQQHEPRVNLKLVQVDPRPETYDYYVSVTFSLVNAPTEVFSFSTVLKRVR